MYLAYTWHTQILRNSKSELQETICHLRKKLTKAFPKASDLSQQALKIAYFSLVKGVTDYGTWSFSS